MNDLTSTALKNDLDSTHQSKKSHSLAPNKGFPLLAPNKGFPSVAKKISQRHFALESLRNGVIKAWQGFLRWPAMAFAGLSAFLLAGCAGITPAHYAAEKPVLDLATYFNGTIDGWGMFQKRSGEIVKRFHVVIDAKWQGDTGVLDEHFRWSDGATSRRVWTLKRHADGRYTGTADDVVGVAEGESAGNALRWKYVLALPVDGKTWHVDFDDWMVLVSDQVMLNRSAMSKWGFYLGEVTLSFTKRPAPG